MDFNYRPTSRLMSPAEVLAERQALQSGQQRNALMQLQMQNAQAEAAQRAQQNALMMQQAQTRSGYLNDLAGNMGPPQEFSPMRALAAGLKPDEIKLMQGPEQKLMNVAPGGAIFDPRTGKSLFTAPFKPEAPKLPEGMRMGANGPEWIPGYLEGRGQVARAGATSVSYGAPITAVNPATGQPELVRPDNKGGMNFTGIKPAGEAEKPLTEGQAKAVLFASRMQAADKVLADLSRKGVKTTIPGATRNDVIGDVITATSPAEQQQLVQAKRDFINAVLRRESGAVIAAEEFANAERQYFPQIGDSRVVIEQKAKNRRAAIEGMRADVPRSRQGEVDRISTGGAAPADESDPLGIRGGK